MKITLENIEEDKWTYLAKREITFLFNSLVIKSYGQTFKELELKNLGDKLVNGTVICGKGLIVRAYRKDEDLTLFRDFFLNEVRDNPNLLKSIYDKALEKSEVALDATRELEQILSTEKLNMDTFRKFYFLFSKIFLEFFTFQVLPFTAEQALAASGNEQVLNSYKSLFVDWREKTQEIEMKIEDLLSSFVLRLKQDLQIDISFWTDDEVRKFLSESAKPESEQVALRENSYALVWDMSLSELYEFSTDDKVVRVCEKLDDLTSVKEEKTEWKGRIINKGKKSGNAYVIKIKNDFKVIPENVIVVAEVVEVDDFRNLKSSNIKAVIVEEGGITSHIAISGRELNVPIIIGIKGISRSIKSGMEVEVDADNGVVRILK